MEKSSLIYIFGATYLLVSGFILYVFYKHGYDVSKTLLYFKKKLGGCCIKNKKQVEKKVGKGELAKIEKNYESEDCKMPLDFPFDLCVSDGLTETDIKLRNNVMKIIKNARNVAIDGGEAKLIVPLEALVFLTKRQSPLVNEDGEIIIVSKEKGLEDNLKTIEMQLKGGGEVYKDPENLLSAIRQLESLHKKIVEIEKSTLEAGAPVEEGGLEALSSKEEKEAEGLSVPEPGGLDLDSLDSSDLGLDEDLDNLAVSETDLGEESESEGEEIADAIKGELDSLDLDSLDLSDLGLEEDRDEEKALSSGSDDLELGDVGIDEVLENGVTKEQKNSLDLDLDSVLDIDEMSGQDALTEKSPAKRASFYKGLSYKSVKNLEKIDFLDGESVERLFEDGEVLASFLHNLIKTKPIIFNKNKTVFYADYQNVFFAISKLYGLDFNKQLSVFRKMKISDIEAVNKNLSEHAFGKIMSDLITNSLDVRKNWFSKGQETFYSFGFYFKSDSLLLAFSQEDADFIRSFPYTTEYRISNKPHEGRGHRMVPSIVDVEI